jgi:hypothetical protein
MGPIGQMGPKVRLPSHRSYLSQKSYLSTAPIVIPERDSYNPAPLTGACGRTRK